MTRQTQAGLRDRLIRIGRSRADISDACERYLTQAYTEITAVFPFRQFQQVANNVVLTNGASELPLASVGTDIRYVTGVRLNQMPRRLKKWSETQLDQRQLYSGMPQHYCLYGQTLYFDTIADQAYTLRVRWQRWPVPPVFTASPLTLETPDQWDDVILYTAAAKLLAEYLEPDRSVVYQGMADDLIGMLPTEEYVEDADYDQGWKPAVR